MLQGCLNFHKSKKVWEAGKMADFSNDLLLRTDISPSAQIEIGFFGVTTSGPGVVSRKCYYAI